MKNPNPRRRSLSLSVLLLTVFAWCALAGEAEAGRGAGLQASDTFGVGERISTILRRLANGAGVAQSVAERVEAQQSLLSLAGARGGLGSSRVSAAVAAQQSLWSTTLTAESFELTGDDGPLRLVGYLWLSDFNQRGALGDPDFDFRGTTHYVRGLFQDRDNWSVWLIIDPPPEAQDVRSMTLTVDGQALAVSDAPFVEENDVLGAVVAWPDPGFRWSDGQRIAAQLTTGQDGGGANQAPRATGSIPAQTLTVGASTAAVNVAPYFADPDGDTLTYTANSSRTAIVRASASGSTVTLTPLAAGTAAVTVTARDPGGLSATQSITVTVAGDGAANAPWSTTLTAESFELTGDDDTLRLVGYLWLSDFNQRGALGDPDFDFRGTTHYVRGLFQDRDNWSVWLIINPPPDVQDVRSMTLTADGQALAVSDSPFVEEDDVLGAVVVWRDPGFRWSDGQRIAVQLTAPDGGGVNQAPRATGSIPAQTLTAGGRSVSVNVAPYFTDPDGDALTYTARSSRTGVVTASVSGSTVILAPVAAGTATISVTARDPAGLGATQLIAVTVATPGVATFTDDPLVPGVTPVRAVHFQELRTRIDALRVRAGLTRFAWTDPVLTPGVTPVRRFHLTELRTALRAAYLAVGQPVPVYTDTRVTPGTTPIRASHITELRTAVVALEALGANRAPQASGSIPAQTLTADTSRVDVAPYFNDPDGDPLTFTAASSRVDVVTVGVAGSIVTLTPVDNGTATVTVIARDPGGLFATQTTAVTVRDTGGGWQRTGSGPAILDLPTSITRIRIEGEYSGRGENFVVWCGIQGDRGGLLVNEILGTRWSSTRYSGVHSALRSYNGRGEPCRQLQIEYSVGVRWQITELSPRSGLYPLAGTGSLAGDQAAVRRALGLRRGR